MSKIPLQPFKTGDFSNLFKQKIPEPIFEVAAAVPASPSPNPDGGGNSNTKLYVVLTIIVVGGAIVVIYLINQNAAMHYQLVELTGEVKTLSAMREQEQSSNNLLSNLKSEEHGTTNKV